MNISRKKRYGALFKTLILLSEIFLRVFSIAPPPPSSYSFRPIEITWERPVFDPSFGDFNLVLGLESIPTSSGTEPKDYHFVVFGTKNFFYRFILNESNQIQPKNRLRVWHPVFYQAFSSTPVEHDISEKSAFHLNGSNYLFIASSLPSFCVSKANVDLYFLAEERFGGCQSDEKIDKVSYVSSDLFAASGKSSLSYRSTSDGTVLTLVPREIIDPSTASQINIERILTIDETYLVVADSANRRIQSLKKNSDGGVVLWDSDPYSLATDSVSSLSFSKKLNVLYICYSTQCFIFDVNTNSATGVSAQGDSFTQGTFLILAPNIQWQSIGEDNTDKIIRSFNDIALFSMIKKTSDDKKDFFILEKKPSAPYLSLEISEKLPGEPVSMGGYQDNKYILVISKKDIFVVYHKICPGGCLECSAPNVCTKCHPSMELDNDHCKPRSCHPDCMSCSGSDSNECLTCPSVSHILSQNGECILKESFVPTCFEENKPDSASGTECQECSSKEAFAVNEMNCTNGSKVRYLNWTVQIISYRINNTLELQFSLPNPYQAFPSISKALNIVDNLNPTQFQLDFDEGVPSQQIISYYSNKIVLGGDLAVHLLNYSTGINISNSNSYRQMLYESMTQRLNIIRQSYYLKTEGNQLSTEDELPENLSKIGKIISKSSSWVGTLTILTSVTGSALSVNVGPTFIKFFQLIEILGKLYFVPVEFSKTLDYFLSLLNGLSDFIEVHSDILMKENPNQPNRYYFKMTKVKEPKYILRSIPIFTILTVVLLTFLSLTWYLSSKLLIFQKIFKLFFLLTIFVLETSFVDFCFYSLYSLVGSYSSLGFNALLVLDRFLALILLFVSMTYLWMVYSAVEALAPRKSPTFKVSFPSGLNTLRRRESQVEPKFSSSLQPFVAIIKDCLKPIQLKRSFNVRLSNFLFQFKILFYQAVVVSCQKSPGFCLGLLVPFELATFIHLIYIASRNRPFKSRLAFFSKMSVDVCLFLFFLVVSLQWLGIREAFIDYSLIALIICCILYQMFNLFMNTVLSVRGYLKKNWRSKKRVNPKAFNDNSRSSSGLVEEASALTTKVRKDSRSNYLRFAASQSTERMSLNNPTTLKSLPANSSRYPKVRVKPLVNSSEKLKEESRKVEPRPFRGGIKGTTEFSKFRPSLKTNNSKLQLSRITNRKSLLKQKNRVSIMLNPQDEQVCTKPEFTPRNRKSSNKLNFEKQQ